MLTQPLVSRPPYGEHAGASRLPEGGPVDRGLPLDSALPGTKTYVKPVEDIREQESDDEPISRVDDAGDLTKERDRIDTREDNADKHDSLSYTPGPGEWDTTVKTKYPYRDDRPHTKIARIVAKFEASLVTSTRRVVLGETCRDTPRNAGNVTHKLSTF